MNGMSRIKNAISALFGLLIIAGFLYAGYHIAIETLVLLSNLKDEVLAALIGAMATVLVGVTATIISQKQSKQRDIEESHRSKKVEIYKGYLDAVAGLIARENENVSKEGMTNQELVDYLLEFKTDILLWGSPKVIKRQLAFQEASKDGGDVIIAVDNLYRAIREDIGLSNKGLNRHELIKLSLSDPGEIDTYK